MIVFQLLAIPFAALLFIRSALRLLRGQRPRGVPLLGVVIWLAAIIALIEPQMTSRVAQAVGIGRGADLVLYLVAFLLVASSSYFYQKCRKLESSVTVLVRHLALQNAIKGREVERPGAPRAEDAGERESAPPSPGPAGS